jgi:hypothetical protein
MWVAKQRVWVWILWLVLVMTSAVGAKPSKPSKAQWQEAEAAVRAHVAAQNQEILEITREPLKSLGTSFWVRFATGGGALMVVRGKDVLAAPGPATITEILRRDDFLRTRTITADDFYYLLGMLEHMPQLDGSPLKDDKMKELNPSWTFSKDGATFTMYGTRPAAPTGDLVTPTRPLTRAQLRIRGDYTLSPWVTEDVDHPIKQPK